MATVIATVMAGWVRLAALALMFGVFPASARYYHHRIDGMAGDFLGVTTILVEIAVLVMFALVYPATVSPWVAG